MWEKDRKRPMYSGVDKYGGDIVCGKGSQEVDVQ